MRTFCELAHTLHTRLASHFSIFVEDFKRNMNEINTSYEIALDTLVILRRLFRSKGHTSSSSDFL